MFLGTFIFIFFTFVIRANSIPSRDALIQHNTAAASAAEKQKGSSEAILALPIFAYLRQCKPNIMVVTYQPSSMSAAGERLVEKLQEEQFAKEVKVSAVENKEVAYEKIRPPLRLS